MHGGIAAAIPASVATPIQGTDLTAIWNLQFSGTGPRTGYTNGVWPAGITPGTGGTNTGIPAYVAGLGFKWANHDGAIYVNVPVSTLLTISNYDFTLCPPITWDGPGIINFVDCKQPISAAFGGNAFVSSCNINGTIDTATGVGTVICDYCTFNIGTFFAGGGSSASWTNNYCTFSNQIQQLGGCSSASLAFVNCYIPGGGCNPPATSHVELVQFNSNSPATLTINNCMIDVHANGQATLGIPGGGNYGWTGVWSSTAGNGTINITNTIMIGVTEVNANPSNPNRINTNLWYGQTETVTVTNTIMEMGVVGFVNNGNSGVYRAGDGGGSRTFANGMLTSATSGWN